MRLKALIFVCLFSASLLGQSAAILPIPKIQILDSNGDPLANGHCHTYETGTTTPLATYTDSTAGTPNANPVVLDAAGRADIWLGNTGAYTIDCDDTNNVDVWSVDGVQHIGLLLKADLADATDNALGDALVAFQQPLTGSAASTLHAKMQEHISVTDFGATGDGVTDDHANLQQALDALTDGDELTIPAGNYLINTSGGLTISTNDVTISAYGATITVGTGTGNTVALTISGDHVSVRGLEMIGDDSGFSNADETDELRRNIKITGDHADISDCRMTEAVFGIEFNGATGGSVSNCFLQNTVITNGLAGTNNNSAGINVKASTGIRVSDNYIDGYGNGILQQGASSQNTYSGNVLLNQDDNGIYGSAGTNYTITGNSLRNIVNSAIKPRGSGYSVTGNEMQVDGATADGIFFTGNGTPDGDGFNGFDIVISGNVISGDYERGITTSDQDSGYVKNAIVTNNTITFDSGGSNTGFCIHYTSAASDGGVISGNQCINGKRGILLAEDTSQVFINMVISDNVVIGEASSAEDAFEFQNLQNSFVSGNLARNADTSRAGFSFIETSTGNIVTGNVCDDTQGTPSQQHGIEETGSADSNIYIANWCGNANTTAPITIAGSASEIHYQPGTYVKTMTGNETFTPGHYHVFILDPGAARNFNPSGTFTPGYMVMVVNAANAAETITFDSAGLAEAVAQNERGIFVFDGTNWLKFYVGS